MDVVSCLQGETVDCLGKINFACLILILGVWRIHSMFKNILFDINPQASKITVISILSRVEGYCISRQNLNKMIGTLHLAPNKCVHEHGS